MQDRYAGDVGDFMKLGLLRYMVGTTGLTLGVNWYLAPEESHNDDGKHVDYLAPSSSSHSALRACDGELMDGLAGVVASGRSVAELERAGVLPIGAETFAARLGADVDRDRWHGEALGHLEDAELVFLDPDNGLGERRGGSKAAKFAFFDEVADYVHRGQSVVVYHHLDRSEGGVPAQVARRLAELADATGTAPLGAVVARRVQVRYFFVVPAPSHRERLEAALVSYQQVWAAHADYIPFGGELEATSQEPRRPAAMAYESLSAALAAHKIPLANHRLIRCVASELDLAEYYGTSSYIRAVRRGDGPDLNIAYGWTNGFVSKDEALRFVGESDVWKSNRGSGQWGITHPENKTYERGVSVRAAQRDYGICQTHFMALNALGECDDCA